MEDYCWNEGEVYSPYEAQLHSLFKSCDSTGKGVLDTDALLSLCGKLGLEQEQSKGLLTKLLSMNNVSTKIPLKVTYGEFKEAFVRFWKELAFAETATLPPGSPDENTLNIMDRENSVGCDDDLQILNPFDLNDTKTDDTDGTSACLYVRKIWDQITGENEYADKMQLALICETIQPKMLPDEMIEQLFLSLDTDDDGKILLDDFLQLFLGCSDIWLHKNKTQVQEVSKSPSIEKLSALSDNEENNLSPSIQTLSESQENFYFTERYTSADEVLKYWNSLEIENGEMVLQDLGFYRDLNLDVENIDVNELSKVLQVELEHCIDSIGLSIPRDDAFLCKAKGKAAIISSRAEVQSLRSALDTAERERLRVMKDLTATNQRVAAFAQDVDEQNARIEESNQRKIKELEKHYLSQIKTLRGELSQEKEKQASLTQEFDHSNRYYSLQLVEQENKLKEDLCQLKKENHQLEEENESLKHKLNESERLNKDLKSELSKVMTYAGSYQELMVASNELVDRANSPLIDMIKVNLEKEVESLAQRVSELADQNNHLKSQLEAKSNGFQFGFNQPLDKEIDESLLNYEMKHHLQCGSRSSKKSGEQMSVESSVLISQIRSLKDEIDQVQKMLDSALQQLESVKSQQALDEEKIVALTSKCITLQTRLWSCFHPEETSSNSTQSLPSGDDARIIPLPDQPFSLPVNIDSLNGPVKKPAELERHCQNLEEELDVVKKEILKILSEKSKCTKENEQLKKALSVEPPLASNESDNSHSDISRADISHAETSKRIHDRSSPDGQEDDISHKKSIPFVSDEKSSVIQSSKDESIIQELNDKCKKLEESLELMGSEFEKMEDYWQSKLVEERNFYEDQIQNSDQRFKDLEAKLREYEELLLNADDITKQPDDDKLSTIEESASLECQVADLENEIDNLRSELKDKEQRMQLELKDVENFWQSKLQQEKASHTVETNALKEALNLLRRQISAPSTSWTSGVKNMSVKPFSEVSEVDGVVDVDLGGEVEDQVPVTFPGSKLVCDAWTQLPGMAGNPSAALSSVALAYQAVLRDIDHEKESLKNELEMLLRTPMNRSPDIGLLSTMEIVQSRLRQQEERCHHLQAALRQQQRHSRRILEEMREQHESEIRNLENLMKASQEMLQQQVTKYSDQMQRLGHSESLVRQLLTENETLVTAIRNLQYTAEN